MCERLWIRSWRMGGKKTSAPPGDRTRVARMGILHDTTTPAVLTTLPDVHMVIYSTKLGHEYFLRRH